MGQKRAHWDFALLARDVDFLAAGHVVTGHTYVLRRPITKGEKKSHNDAVRKAKSAKLKDTPYKSTPRHGWVGDEACQVRMGVILELDLVQKKNEVLHFLSVYL